MYWLQTTIEFPMDDQYMYMTKALSGSDDDLFLTHVYFRISVHVFSLLDSFFLGMLTDPFWQQPDRQWHLMAIIGIMLEESLLEHETLTIHAQNGPVHLSMKNL